MLVNPDIDQIVINFWDKEVKIKTVCENTAYCMKELYTPKDVVRYLTEMTENDGLRITGATKLVVMGNCFDYVYLMQSMSKLKHLFIA